MRLITPQEYIDDLYDGIDFPIDRNKFELISKLMTDYAKYYHRQQVESVDLADVVKRTLERKEAACACVNMWYEKEYDSSTPDDEVASMDKEAAELNAQIKVLRHILSEVGEL